MLPFLRVENLTIFILIQGLKFRNVSNIWKELYTNVIEYCDFNHVSNVIFRGI